MALLIDYLKKKKKINLETIYTLPPKMDLTACIYLFVHTHIHTYIHTYIKQ